jgi:hypothetical protein
MLYSTLNQPDICSGFHYIRVFETINSIKLAVILMALWALIDDLLQVIGLVNTIIFLPVLRDSFLLMDDLLTVNLSAISF